MTRKQLKDKYNFLRRQVNEHLQNKFERALKSGALEIVDYQDDFVLPKIILWAVLKDEAVEWEPCDPVYR